MATVADIIVVQDGKSRLKKGQPISIGLSIPKNIDRDSHSVLTFMVDSVGGLDGFAFHAELSGGPGGLTKCTRRLPRRAFSRRAGSPATRPPVLSRSNASVCL